MYDGLLIDLAIVMILVVAALSGLVRGALREVASLALWLLVIGLVVAHFDAIVGYLDGWVADPPLHRGLVALVIMLLAAFVLASVDVGLRLLHVRAGAASRDPLLGLISGFLRGALFVTLGVVLAHRTVLPDRLAWYQSQFVGYAEVLVLALRHHLPPAMASQIVLRQEGETERRVVLLRDSRGHYMGRAEVNGVPVSVLVDTGATMVMIPARLKEPLGLQAGYPFPVNTATGQTVAQHVMIDVFRLGPIELHDVEAALVESPKDTVLIGMSFLLRTRFQQTVDGLLLEQVTVGLE